MAYDVTQWLTEIRTLQRQLADTQKERDQAYASAANWRRLYETEARQRRTETEELKTHLQSLEAELSYHRNGHPATEVEAHSGLEGSHPSGDAMEVLQIRLSETLALCQELTRRLEAEQAAHALTRQTLTTALGDAFDALKPEHPAATSTKVPHAGDGVADSP